MPTTLAATELMPPPLLVLDSANEVYVTGSTAIEQLSHHVQRISGDGAGPELRIPDPGIR